MKRITYTATMLDPADPGTAMLVSVDPNAGTAIVYSLDRLTCAWCPDHLNPDPARHHADNPRSHREHA